MPTLKLDDLKITRRQSITLQWHRKSKQWWAVLWQDEDFLTGSENDTAIAALSELLVEIGHRPDDMN